MKRKNKKKVKQKYGEKNCKQDQLRCLNLKLNEVGTENFKFRSFKFFTFKYIEIIKLSFVTNSKITKIRRVPKLKLQKILNLGPYF